MSPAIALIAIEVRLLKRLKHKSTNAWIMQLPMPLPQKSSASQYPNSQHTPRAGAATLEEMAAAVSGVNGDRAMLPITASEAPAAS